MKIRSVGAEFFHGRGQSDRYDESNASKNGSWRIKDVTDLGNNPIKVSELGAFAIWDFVSERENCSI